MQLVHNTRPLIVLLRDYWNQISEEISNLGILCLKFAILLIKVINLPDMILIQKMLLTTLKILLAIFCYHRDVQIVLLGSDKKQNLMYPLLDLNFMNLEVLLLRLLFNLIENKFNFELNIILKLALFLRWQQTLQSPISRFKFKKLTLQSWAAVFLEYRASK